MIFEPKVSITEDHRYFHNNGEEYIGFSNLYEFLVKPFNNEISGFVAKSRGVSKQDVLNEWDSSRNEGVRIDQAIALYSQKGIFRDEDLDIKDAVIEILKVYSQYKITYDQLIVYNETHKTAGTLDKICLTSNRNNSKFIISDFKCYEDNNLYEARGWLAPPLSHLPNSKFVKCALQLSYYAYHIEELTGKKCDGLFVHLINPSSCKKIDGKLDLKWEKIYFCYLRHDVQILLETFKEQITSRLTNKNEFVI